jgi:hypothetical protein
MGGGMKLRLIATFLFNLIDTFSTLYLVQALGLEEANPVCRFLLDISPVLFLAVKLVGFNLVLLYLWLVREYKLAQIGTWIPFIVYGLLVAYHGFIIYVLWDLNLL